MLGRRFQCKPVQHQLDAPTHTHPRAPQHKIHLKMHLQAPAKGTRIGNAASTKQIMLVTASMHATCLPSSKADLEPTRSLFSIWCSSLINLSPTCVSSHPHKTGENKLKRPCLQTRCSSPIDSAHDVAGWAPLSLLHTPPQGSCSTFGGHHPIHPQSLAVPSWPDACATDYACAFIL